MPAVRSGDGVVSFDDDVHDGVVVDVRGHDLLVRGAGLKPVRFGSTSAGLVEAIRLVRTATGGVFTDAAIFLPLHGALREVATRPGLDEAIAAVQGLRPTQAVTPLLFSHRVLQQPHLLQDLARFRAAAVALTAIDEQADVDDTTPEYAEHLGFRLGRWQALYCAKGSVARSVNRTLALFGDDASPSALWGLRHLVIDAPVASLQHLEVLGHLYANVADANPDQREQLKEIVKAAPAHQLGEALVLIDEGEIDAVTAGLETPAGLLAAVLRAPPIEGLKQRFGRRPHFQEVLEEALHELQQVLRLKTEVAAPRIRLPAVRGVRFLRTVADIADEGVRMNHCVATRAPGALAGESFLFHVERLGELATAEVDATGHIIEVRGPRNAMNRAVSWARRVLRPWGKLLRLKVQITSLPPWPGEVRASDPGLEPVTDLAALIAFVVGLTREPDAGDDVLVDWIVEHIEGVASGRTFVAVDRRGPVLHLLDRSGRSWSSSAQIVADDFGEATPPMGTDPWGDLQNDDDDDPEDHWDDRT